MHSKHPGTDKTKPTTTQYITVEALKQFGETLKTIAEELNSSPKKFIGHQAIQGASYGLKAMGTAGARMSRLAKEGLSMLQLLERHPDLGLADAVTIGKSYINGYVEKTSQKVGEAIYKGKAITDGLTGDAEKLLKEALGGGGKQLLERMNETAVKGYEKVMALLKLPSREEIEKLTKSMEKLSQRVDSLKCRAKGGGHAKN